MYENEAQRKEIRALIIACCEIVGILTPLLDENQKLKFRLELSKRAAGYTAPDDAPIKEIFERLSQAAN